jgi:hypothetical protein
MRIFTLLFALTFFTPAFAGKANVIAVKAYQEAANSFRFEVTIRSDDTGWEKYADKWEVLAPDGEVLGLRVLAHPHETEQPFTRDLSGVKIPADVNEVRVRAHDSVAGFGGDEVLVKLPR